MQEEQGRHRAGPITWQERLEEVLPLRVGLCGVVKMVCLQGVFQVEMGTWYWATLDRAVMTPVGICFHYPRQDLGVNEMDLVMGCMFQWMGGVSTWVLLQAGSVLCSLSSFSLRDPEYLFSK